jgi:DNA N6-methyl adenine demethylase
MNCVCSGIRQCALCCPKKSKNVLKIEIETHLQSKNIYKYCNKCNLSVRFNNLKDDSVELEQFLTTHNIDDNKSSCNCQNQNESDLINIKGIFVYTDFITKEQEQYLSEEINKINWIHSQSGRRKQDYGPKANFKKKKLNSEWFTGLPFYSKFILSKLDNLLNDTNEQIFKPVEQCNLFYDHERGASIDPHFDDTWLWGDRLITVNLLSNTFLTLTPGDDDDDVEKYKNVEILIPLPRRSLVILSKSARYLWKHSIKSFHIHNDRMAITFREMSDHLNSEIVDSIQKLAVQFKGVSVGQIEQGILDSTDDIIDNDDNQIDNFYLFINDKSIKIKSDLENSLNDCFINNMNEQVVVNLGENIAKWRLFLSVNFLFCFILISI